MVRAIPEGFGTVSVSLVVPEATEAVAFYARAFGAEPGSRMVGPDGESTMYAEMRIGDSTVMLSDENPQWGMKSPKSLGGTAASIHLYVEDADGIFSRAVEAGCEVVFPIDDTFWGDRYGKVRDPFGHSWGIATHLEDLEDGEIARRAAEWFASRGGG